MKSSRPESNTRLAPQLGAAKLRGQQQQKLRAASGQRPTNASRMATRGRHGRGGQRGGSRRTSKPLTKEQLDRELDNYVMRDNEMARNKLDSDLDAYMADVQTEGNAA
ncbi:hypothetical protein SYNPS1DRAFT_27669 [Syncephalis pseudoplumigaleata]|uniref:Chromatin target of PRMT1 protein C-terminal domain-containing protein n=1 Tax=Syncephalis pseudoplumigaleata TaxID=1712513 RepID=A0A4P9Z2M4_9FUNG|nr:hypothetical protein SYNPS1DRAFT_27669 [Syncephalis pseudoplumigaleata]|eukprot:RKP26656.1 hypothetical protein SYNPS1DRAFT_27669 [Syncephalis pseudoplumigaleata]